MNNEPVGVVTEFEGILVGTLFEQLPDGTKLYTYPAKTLTDEEILEIANQCLIGATAWHNPDLDPIEFARAILRKAQEK